MSYVNQECTLGQTEIEHTYLDHGLHLQHQKDDDTEDLYQYIPIAPVVKSNNQDNVAANSEVDSMCVFFFFFYFFIYRIISRATRPK